MGTALLALFAGSCTNEQSIEEGTRQLFTLDAQHGFDSRTALGSYDATLWSKDDKIFVSSEDGSVTGVLTLVSGENSDKATFTGYLNGSPSAIAYSIYPVPNNGNKIDLSKNNNGSGKLNAPMIGGLNGNKVAFANAGGLVRLDFPAEAAGDIVDMNTNDQSVGGTYTPAKVDGQWVLKYTPSKKSTKITVPTNGGSVYVPVNAETNPKSVIVTLSIEGKGSVSGSVDVQKNMITQDNESGVKSSSFTEFELDEDTFAPAESEIMTIGNFDDLAAAFNNGGYYKLDNQLSNDITVTSALTLGNNKFLELDLNGKGLSGQLNNPLITLNANSAFAVKNSGNAGGAQLHNETDVIKIAGANAALNIGTNVRVHSSEACCIWIHGSSEPKAHGATVEISGTLESNADYDNGDGDAAVFVNGNVKDVTMNIEGAKITSNNVVGVYFAGDGNLTVDGSATEIIGSESAIEYRGEGNLLIADGIFEATRSPFEADYNGNGTVTTGVAVAISPYWDRAQYVRISGGTFTAADADCYSIWEGYAVNPSHNRVKSNKVFISTSSIEVNGKIHSESAPDVCSEGCNGTHVQVEEQ